MRAALPCRQHRLALVGLMIAASIAGTAVSADRSPAAAPADKLLGNRAAHEVQDGLASAAQVAV